MASRPAMPGRHPLRLFLPAAWYTLPQQSLKGQAPAFQPQAEAFLSELKDKEPSSPVGGIRTGRLFLFALLAALSLSWLSGQPANRPDLSDLQQKLRMASGQDRTEVLLEIASALKESTPQEALANALEAIPSAQAFGQMWSLIRARLIVGECYLRLKEYDKCQAILDLNRTALRGLLPTPLARFRGEKLFEALYQNSRLAADGYLAAAKYREAWPYCLEALGYQKKRSHPGSSGAVLYQAGLICYHLADYPKASAYAADALNEARRASEARLLARSFHLLGAISLKQNRLPEALAHFRRALNLALQEKDLRQASLSRNEIGHVLILQGNFGQALTFQQGALQEARQAQDTETLARVLHDFGSTCLKLNRPEEALPLFQESMALILTPERAREMYAAVRRLASAELDGKNARRALRLFQDYMPLAEKAGLWEEVLDDTLKLSDIHRRLGNWQASAAALRQAYDLRNRMFEEERVRLTREIEARYESEKKQKEYNLLRHEIRIKALDLNQKSLQISFLLALSALALIMALILYNRYRFRLKAHQELEQANRQIQEKQVQLTEANRRLDELTREDPLTGLANRREILSRFDQERVRSLRSGRPFSVIMADLDDFKVFNDTYGHNCGDDILKTLASLLRSMIRGQDVVGRWGGDEFLILLPETRLSGGEAVARKVRAKVRRTAFPWKEKNLKMLLSLGVSVYKKGMDFDDCLKSADQAMFRHKRRRKSVRLPA